MRNEKTTTGGDRTQKFIARDVTGSALQFTGSGRSVQCADMDADVFTSEDDALAALVAGEETQGVVEAHAEQPKHTPGPWKAHLNVPTAIIPGHITKTDDGDGVESSIALLWEGGGTHGKPRQIANARLIAAAPELLEALERLHIAVVNQHGANKIATAIKQSRAAIAKAKGTQI